MYTEMDQLTKLPEALHAEVASFIGLDYLRLRACSRKFRALLAKKRTISTFLCENEREVFRKEFYRPVDCVAGVYSAINDFTSACSIGLLAVAQWLAARHRLTPMDARSLDNYALRWACATGSRTTAAWLVTYFDLTAADVRSRDNWTLREVCGNSHLTTAQWLVKCFGLTIEDAKDCTSSDTATAAWLAAFRAGTWHR